ncbi:MAG: hypothetical protein FWD17_06330 [Polyangiaceae bacterium]|nr:hypothetical protein [Polyangiaceae bacterium]
MLAFGAAISVVFAQALSSGPVEPIRLAYHVPQQCPGEAQFLAEVASRTALARMAADGEAAREFVIDITQGPGGSLSGALEIHASGGVVTRREISGSPCVAVVSALAMMVALAVDPDTTPFPASSAQATPPRSPEPPAADGPDAGAPVVTWGEPVPPVGSAPPPVPPPAPPPPPPPPPDSAPAPLAPSVQPVPSPARSTNVARRARERPHVAANREAEPEASQGHLAMGVQGQVLVGFAPAPVAGAGVTLDYVADPDRVITVGLRFSLSAATTAPTFAGGVGARLVWAWARAEGCPFRFRLASALRFAPCLGLDAGLLHAQGTGLATPATDMPPRFAADAMARLAWTLGGWLIDAGVGAHAPFEHDALRYRVGDVTHTAWKAPSVAFMAEVGLAHWLP